MPFRPRRKPARRPRRKVMNGRRRVVKASKQVHHFKRTALISTITQSWNQTTGTGVNIAGAYTFSLSQLPNVSDFSNLYDQYKITGAKLSFTPGQTEYIGNVLSGQTGAQAFNKFHSVIDYDDAVVPSSENDLLQYGSLKSTQGGRTHTRFIKPKILQEVYRSAISTAYNPISNRFLDMNYTDVPHYGIKVWSSAPVSPASCALTYNVYLTLYFTCKNTR